MVEVSFIGNFEIMDYKENTKCLQFALEKLLKSFKAEDRPKLMDQKQAIFCHVPKGAGPTTCYVYMYIYTYIFFFLSAFTLNFFQCLPSLCLVKKIK